MKRPILAIFVFVALASLLFLPQIPTQKALAASTLPNGAYGNCPNPYTFCHFYHPESEMTGFCGYEACFEINSSADGVSAVRAADDSGDFPKTWSVWHEGTLEPAGTYPCLLTGKENKSRVHIRDEYVPPKCRVDLLTNDGHYKYHEHFASNPSTGCLGWVECKERLQ